VARRKNNCRDWELFDRAMIPVNQRANTLISRMSRIGQSSGDGLDEKLTAVSCPTSRSNENRQFTIDR